MRKLLAVLLTCILLVGSVSVLSHADFGDYGGDSDFGDWGGNDYDYDFDWDDDDDDDYYDNDRYYGGSIGSSSGGDSDLTLKDVALVALVIAAIIAYRIFVDKYDEKHKKSKASHPSGATPTEQSTLQNVDAYLRIDPQFSQTQFCEKVSNMYVRFQNAWQDKNMESLRPYLTDAMYTRCDRQLDAYRQKKQTNRVERIAVLDTKIMGWKTEGGMDKMVVRLKTRIVDYVVDDATGNIIRGSKTAEKFMDYEWTLVRTAGQKTQKTGGTTAQSCPHCGATVNINHSAQCDYCGSILTTDTFDWAVSEIKGIAQKTVG